MSPDKDDDGNGDEDNVEILRWFKFPLITKDTLGRVLVLNVGNNCYL